jgi:hypothetical protein
MVLSCGKCGREEWAAKLGETLSARLRLLSVQMPHLLPQQLSHRLKLLDMLCHYFHDGHDRHAQ